MSSGAPDFTFVFPGDPETLTGGYTYGRRIVAACQSLGAAVEILALPNGYPVPDAENLARTEDIIDAIPDDTLVVFDGLAFSALPALVAKHAARLRFIALVHHPLADETGVPAEKRWHFFESEKDSLSHAKSVIVSSPFTKIRLKDFGVEPDRCHVVEPGIDTAPFNDIRDNVDPVRLLYVASLTERKGHLDLFEALHTLNSSHWMLDLVGPADLAPEYGAKVLEAAKAFGASVRYHGPLPESALADLYREADLYVSPAKYEGYGMALASAVVYGMPIIAVDGGAVATTPAGHAANLVPVDDPAMLAQALRQAINDPSERQRLAQRSRETRAGLNDWTDAGRKFLTALKSV